MEQGGGEAGSSRPTMPAEIHTSQRRLTEEFEPAGGEGAPYR